MTPSQKDAILNGQTYVNVHTTANGSGEIRGQLSPVLHQAFLNSYNERPAIFAAGSGSATLALVGTNLYLSATYRGLTGTATLSHIHGPAGLSASAGVLVIVVKRRQFWCVRQSCGKGNPNTGANRECCGWQHLHQRAHKRQWLRRNSRPNLSSLLVM